MKSDPPVRADGRCASCEGPRPPKPLPVKTTLIPNLRALVADDPFCSTDCARIWHNAPRSRGIHGQGYSARNPADAYFKAGAPS